MALGLWIAGVPETLTPEKLAAVNSDLALDDKALQGVLDSTDQMRMLRRSPRLADVAATAAFLASTGPPASPARSSSSPAGSSSASRRPA